MKTSLSDDYFNQGQKGDSRFRTIEEIQQVYKEIPDKDKRKQDHRHASSYFLFMGLYP